MRSGTLSHPLLMCMYLTSDDAPAMLRVVKDARLRAGDGTVLYISPELSALRWAARVFAERVVHETLNEASAATEPHSRAP